MKKKKKKKRKEQDKTRKTGQFSSKDIQTIVMKKKPGMGLSQKRENEDQAKIQRSGGSGEDPETIRKVNLDEDHELRKSSKQEVPKRKITILNDSR